MLYGVVLPDYSIQDCGAPSRPWRAPGRFSVLMQVGVGGLGGSVGNGLLVLVGLPIVRETLINITLVKDSFYIAEDCPGSLSSGEEAKSDKLFTELQVVSFHEP